MHRLSAGSTSTRAQLATLRAKVLFRPFVRHKAGPNRGTNFHCERDDELDKWSERRYRYARKRTQVRPNASVETFEAFFSKDVLRCLEGAIVLEVNGGHAFVH